MGRVTRACQVVRIDRDAADTAEGARDRSVGPALLVRRTGRPDTLAVEEPLEIRIGSRPLTVTMRTPGDDFDLVAGFLVGEGVLGAADDVRSMRHCATSFPQPLRAGGSPMSVAVPGGVPGADNVVDVALSPDTPLPETLERSFAVTSACGVCGKTSIDGVLTRGRWSVRDDPLRVGSDVVASLPETLRAAQRVFERTGGLHAAGLFDPDGRLLCLREDVGRHNAVDKVVGWALRDGRLPLRGHLLLVSGRASFELTQKAVCAGIPLLAAVSAPSSLAVDLARSTGLTLVGFLRGGTMNVYAADERILD